MDCTDGQRSFKGNGRISFNGLIRDSRKLTKWVIKTKKAFSEILKALYLLVPPARIELAHMD